MTGGFFISNGFLTYRLYMWFFASSVGEEPHIIIDKTPSKWHFAKIYLDILMYYELR